MRFPGKLILTLVLNVVKTSFAFSAQRNQMKHILPVPSGMPSLKIEIKELLALVKSHVSSAQAKRPLIGPRLIASIIIPPSHLQQAAASRSVKGYARVKAPNFLSFSHNVSRLYFLVGYAQRCASKGQVPRKSHWAVYRATLRAVL